MSDSQPQSQWLWSDTLNEWYYPAVENGRNVLVLRNGRRQPVPTAPNPNNPRTISTPQNITSAVDRNDTSNQYGNTANSASYLGGQYGQSPPSRSYMASASAAYGTQQLTDQMGALNVASASNSQGQMRNVREYEQYGVKTLIATGPNGEKVLRGTNGDKEVLDPSYKKRDQPRRFFTVGKMFSTLWTEPAGSNNTYVTPVRFGGEAYTSIRRFVVVREGTNYCTAAPITTYGGRGLVKGSTDPSEHALIYVGRQPPPLTTADQGLLPIAIQVEASEAGVTLDPMSRLNLGKIYTIEHNLKVKPLGVVKNKDELLQAVAHVHRGDSTVIVARESGSTLNTPIKPAGRSGQRADDRQRAPVAQTSQAAQGQDPVTLAARLQAALHAGQIDAARFQAGMVRLGSSESQAAQRARAIMQARQDQAADDEDDDEDDDDDDDEDEDEEEDDEEPEPDPRRRRQHGQSQGRRG